MNLTSWPLVKVGTRHQVTIPKAIVKLAALKPGEYVAFSVEANKIVLSPKAVVDRPDAWFWSKEWQTKEREADEDIKAGRVKSFNNVDDLIKDLRAKPSHDED